MSDMETAGAFGAIAAGVVMAIKEIGAAIVKAMRRKSAEDREARDDAKAENASRDLWIKINKVDDDLSQHRIDDAAAFATLNTTQSSILKVVERMESKVDAMHRRATGEVQKRSGR